MAPQPTLPNVPANLTFLLPVLLLLLPSPAAADAPLPTEQERVFLEAGWGVSQGRADAYTRRLEQFNFRRGGSEGSSAPSLVGMASLGVMLTRHLGLLARYEGLEHREYSRDFADASFLDGDDFFAWTTRAVSLGVRGRLPLREEWFALYGETSAGFAWARTRAWGESIHDRQLFRGLALGARVGILGHATRNLGFFAEGGYTYAPVIENLLGETHDDGGISFITGVRLRLMGSGS